MANIASNINSNIEKVNRITVVSSSGATSAERQGLIFGGYGYSADVSVNDGDGYTITIRVISNDGKYSIKSEDLNPNNEASKNINIGNFTFYDFYLISYEKSKTIDSHILTLTYKDKSIFMDRLYIALLNNEFGSSVNYDANKLPISLNDAGIVTTPTSASFRYSCTEGSIINSANIRRNLRSCYTNTTNFNKTIQGVDWNDKEYKHLQSKAFLSKYNFDRDGSNGAYIAVGREEISEETCTIHETSYSFTDLTSALFHSGVPGIAEFNLSDNAIFRNLRRSYSGTLRDVLNNWGNDFGYKFYYQPQIDFRTKDYSNNTISKVEINEGLKYIDLNSTKTNISNIDDILLNHHLKKVIESYSERATLEGTKKSKVITPMKRAARTFSSSNDSRFVGSAAPMSLSVLPTFLNFSPSNNRTIINGTLMQYDEELRDIYALREYGPEYLGITNYENVFTNVKLVSSLDFLKIFGSEGGDDPVKTLDDYVCYICSYDAAKHEAIKEWEKKVMGDFYGKYFQITNLPNNATSCGVYSNFNIEYTTDPQSQTYPLYEVPYKDLLLNAIPSNSRSITNPIFQVDNPYDHRNSDLFNTFKTTLETVFKDKSIKFINLKEDAAARNALLSCLNPSYTNVINFINSEDITPYIILSPKYVRLNIELQSGVNNNNSITTIGQNQTTSNNDSNKECGKTVCQENLFDILCENNNNSNNNANKVNSGFLGKSSSYLTLSHTDPNTSLNLILPTHSSYQYVIQRNASSVSTIPGANYVFGSPPIKEGNEKYLSSAVNINNPPEVLTQAYSTSGIQDLVVGFDDNGNQTSTSSLKVFHENISKQSNESILEPQISKTLSLTSTYIPVQLQDYVFGSSVLNNVSFSLGENGVNLNLEFSNRPKYLKPRDILFETKKFLYTL